MGRTIIAEEALQERLTAIAKSANFQFGLLIGKNSKDKDYIVHIAPTPPDDQYEEDENNESEDSKCKSANSISDVAEDTVVQHARQVIRMLPGGLDILGIYIVTPQSDLSNMLSQTKLVKLLASIHKATSKLLLDTSQPTTEKAVLHVCPQTLKVASKSLDVSLSGSLLVPLELKFQRGNIKWHQISYSYALNLKLWLPTDKAHSLYKNVLNLVRPWATSVAESLVLIDCNLVDEETLLDATGDEKPSKKKGGARAIMDLAPPKVYVAEILDSCGPVEDTYKEKESGGSVHISGTIAGRAFVQGKDTTGEASRAVITDLIRSVVSRWEMHCDSLVEEELSTGPVVHEPPRRVFLEGGGLPVSLCDYLFPGDTAADTCSSAKELLNITVHEENVDETGETLADVSVLLDTRADVVEDLQGDLGLESPSAKRDPACSFIHVAMAVAVAVVGIGVSYLTLQGNKTLT